MLNEDEQKIEKSAPKVIRGAIEDVCKTPFRILGNFGKGKLAQFKGRRTDW